MENIVENTNTCSPLLMLSLQIEIADIRSRLKQLSMDNKTIRNLLLEVKNTIEVILRQFTIEPSREKVEALMFDLYLVIQLGKEKNEQLQANLLEITLLQIKLVEVNNELLAEGIKCIVG